MLNFNSNFKTYCFRTKRSNPLNPIATVKYAIPKSSYVSVKVFDMLGNLIETLVAGDKSAGNYTVRFDASKLSSGVYFYQLATPAYISTKKLVLMK